MIVTAKAITKGFYQKTTIDASKVMCLPSALYEKGSEGASFFRLTVITSRNCLQKKTEQTKN